MKKCRICGENYEWWNDHVCSPVNNVCGTCHMVPCECDD